MAEIPTTDLSSNWLERELAAVRSSPTYHKIMADRENDAAVQAVLVEFDKHPHSMAQAIVNLRRAAITTPRWVRMMADFSSDGLWELDGCMMDREDLPISQCLKERHIEWCDWYERDCQDYLPESQRTTTFDEAEFSRVGREIATAIKGELPAWTVMYFDLERLDLTRDDQPRVEFEYEVKADAYCADDANFASDVRTLLAELASSERVSADRYRCPNCHKEAEVKITRHRTASPRHVDLTCECQTCGVIWEAAESV